MNLLETLKQQGGRNLLKEYIKTGSFIPAVSLIALLGKSRTSLELVRLVGQKKTKEFLEKKYSKTLNKFDSNYIQKEQDNSNKIWVCWLQGIENAPIIVRACIESLECNLREHEIVLLNKHNIMDYVSFPDFIIDKWQKGVISNTHLTDLLRLELLTKYGGTWIDSTVLCTSKADEIPKFFFDSNLFMFQCLKPGRDGHSIYPSSWFIHSYSYNRILMATKALCYKYWEENDSMIDYFLLHYFLSIVMDYYDDDWNKIIPFDNGSAHELLFQLNNKYDDELFKATIRQSPFHKLTYKNVIHDSKVNTFYDEIIKRYLNCYK